MTRSVSSHSGSKTSARRSLPPAVTIARCSWRCACRKVAWLAASPATNPPPQTASSWRSRLTSTRPAAWRDRDRLDHAAQREDFADVAQRDRLHQIAAARQRLHPVALAQPHQRAADRRPCRAGSGRRARPRRRSIPARCGRRRCRRAASRTRYRLAAFRRRPGSARRHRASRFPYSRWAPMTDNLRCQDRAIDISVAPADR